MIKKFLYFQICAVVISSCGFKVIDEAKLRNFDINLIETTGENRINFIIKNSLRLNNNKSNRKINLYLDTQKNKEVKERNIKNEITKYSISIKTNIRYSLVGGNMEGSFSISKVGNYSLADQYSQSMTNEKKLIESLSSEIQKEIINNLIILFNDL